MNEAFEATIHNHYFAKPWRCGGKIGEMAAVSVEVLDLTDGEIKEGPAFTL